MILRRRIFSGMSVNSNLGNCYKLWNLSYSEKFLRVEYYLLSVLRMPFCPYCGRPVPEWAKFCKYCGGKLTEDEMPPEGSPYSQPLLPQPPPSQPMIMRERIPDTSRLSRVGIQKFLSPGEKIIFRTRSRVWLGNQIRYAYVTNKRLLFYYQVPKLMGLIKDDRVDEIFINQIRRLSLVEKGLITKSIILHIDEFEVKGDRGDLLELYRVIQSVRGSS